MVQGASPTNPVNIALTKAAERMLIECPFFFEILCEKNISHVFESAIIEVMERVALVMKSCLWQLLNQELLDNVKKALESYRPPEGLEYVEVICCAENNSGEDLDERKINVEIHMKHVVTREMGWFAVTTHFANNGDTGRGDVKQALS